jgi:Tol biopolymer transport system component
MNADGTDLKKVQMPDMVCGSPEWFPDGTKIAFDAWKVGDGHTHARVFTIELEGGAPRDLGPGAMPCWSSDGKQIAFHTYEGNGGVWVMNADGAGRLRICDGYSPRWSPDSSKIACLGFDQAGAGIFIFDVVEGVRTKVYAESQRGLRPGLSWSPDGKRLCFTGKRNNSVELCIVGAENPNGDVKVRSSGELGERAAWSPDGHGILIWRTRENAPAQQLHVIDPDTDAEPVLINGQNTPREGSDPAWSRDGKKIVFTTKD